MIAQPFDTVAALKALSEATGSDLGDITQAFTYVRAELAKSTDTILDAMTLGVLNGIQGHGKVSDVDIKDLAAKMREATVQ